MSLFSLARQTHVRSMVQLHGRRHLSKISSIMSWIRHTGNPNKKKMDLVEDYIIPYRLADRQKCEKMRHPSARRFSMTFSDDKGDPIEISYCIEHAQQNRMRFLKQYRMIPDDLSNWRRAIKSWSYMYRMLSKDTSKFNVRVGKEVLSWLCTGRGFVAPNDVPEFEALGQPLDFCYDFIIHLTDIHSLYPPNSKNMKRDLEVLYYHCSATPQRDVSKIRQGYHFWGAGFPEVCFQLEIIEPEKALASKYNSTEMKELANSMTFSWDGPVIKILTKDKTVFMAQCFWALRNELCIGAMSKEPMWSWNNDRGDVPKYQTDGVSDEKCKVRVQVMGKNLQALERAMSMITNTELRKKCVVTSDIRSFFYAVCSPQTIATATVDNEVLTEFLKNLETCREKDKQNSKEWCAIEILFDERYLNMGWVKFALYNPVTERLIVTQPSIHAMLDFFSPDFEDTSSANIHLFEILPDPHDWKAKLN